MACGSGCHELATVQVDGILSCLAPILMEYLVSPLSSGMLESAALHLASLATRKEKSVRERKRNTYKGQESDVCLAVLTTEKEASFDASNCHRLSSPVLRKG